MIKEYTFDTSEYIIERSNKTIYGELYRPLTDKEKLPIIIICHGYNSCCEGVRYEAELLAKRGVASYCFDFCGGGLKTKSSGKPVEMTIRTEQNDLEEVIKEISALPFVDKENICLFGMSQGGFVSALTAPDHKEMIKALFLVFPAFCIPDDWAERSRNNKSELIEFNGMCVSRRFVDELPEYDVFEKAAEFDKKVFIFHGDSDPVVKVSYSEKLVKSYKNATLTVFPGQQHWFTGEYSEQMMDTICNYIKENG